MAAREKAAAARQQQCMARFARGGKQTAMPHRSPLAASSKGGAQGGGGAAEMLPAGEAGRVSPTDRQTGGLGGNGAGNGVPAGHAAGHANVQPGENAAGACGGSGRDRSGVGEGMSDGNIGGDNGLASGGGALTLGS